MVLVDPAMSALCSYNSITAIIYKYYGRKCGVMRESFLLNRDKLDVSLYADL